MKKENKERISWMHQLEPGEYGIIEDKECSHNGHIVGRMWSAHDWTKCADIGDPSNTWECTGANGIAIRVRRLPAGTKILVTVKQGARIVKPEKKTKPKGKKK